MSPKPYGLEPSPLRIAEHSCLGTPDELRRARERQVAGKDEFKRYEQVLRAKPKGRRRPPYLFDFPREEKALCRDPMLDDQDTVSTDFFPQDVGTDPSLSTEYIPTLSPTSRRPPRVPVPLQRAGSGGARLSPSSRTANYSPRSWQPSFPDRPSSVVMPLGECHRSSMMTRYPIRDSNSSSEEIDRSNNLWEQQARTADAARDRQWIKLARKARALKLNDSNFLLPSQSLSAFEQLTSPILTRVWLDQAGDMNLSSSHGTLLLEEPLQSVIEELIFQVENSLLREGALKEELNRLKGRVANLNRQLMYFRRQSDSYDDEEEQEENRRYLPRLANNLGYMK